MFTAGNTSSNKTSPNKTSPNPHVAFRHTPDATADAVLPMPTRAPSLEDMIQGLPDFVVSPGMAVGETQTASEKTAMDVDSSGGPSMTDEGATDAELVVLPGRIQAFPTAMQANLPEGAVSFPSTVAVDVVQAGALGVPVLPYGSKPGHFDYLLVPELRSKVDFIQQFLTRPQTDLQLAKIRCPGAVTNAIERALKDDIGCFPMLQAGRGCPCAEEGFFLSCGDYIVTNGCCALLSCRGPFTREFALHCAEHKIMLHVPAEAFDANTNYVAMAKQLFADSGSQKFTDFFVNMDADQRKTYGAKYGCPLYASHIDPECTSFYIMWWYNDLAGQWCHELTECSMHNAGTVLEIAEDPRTQLRAHGIDRAAVNGKPRFLWDKLKDLLGNYIPSVPEITPTFEAMMEKFGKIITGYSHDDVAMLKGLIESGAIPEISVLKFLCTVQNPKFVQHCGTHVPLVPKILEWINGLLDQHLAGAEQLKVVFEYIRFKMPAELALEKAANEQRIADKKAADAAKDVETRALYDKGLTTAELRNQVDAMGLTLAANTSEEFLDVLHRVDDQPVTSESKLKYLRTVTVRRGKLGVKIDNTGRNNAGDKVARLIGTKVTPETKVRLNQIFGFKGDNTKKPRGSTKKKKNLAPIPEGKELNHELWTKDDANEPSQLRIHPDAQRLPHELALSRMGLALLPKVPQLVEAVGGMNSNTSRVTPPPEPMPPKDQNTNAMPSVQDLFGSDNEDEQGIDSSTFSSGDEKEQLAPEQLAPEELTPEQLAPEELAPEQLAPEQLAPEQLAPEQLAPEQLAPEEPAVRERIKFTIRKTKKAAAPDAKAKKADAEAKKLGYRSAAAMKAHMSDTNNGRSTRRGA